MALENKLFMENETFSSPPAYLEPEDVMRAYLSNLTPTARMLLLLPVVGLAYPLVTIVLPAMIRALLPDVVRSVFSLI